MKLVFIGSTILTRTCIENIMKLRKDEIIAVVTIPDKNLHSRARGVLFDDITGISVIKTDDIGSNDIFDTISGIKPDVVVQCGWSQKIPQKILDIPKHGCIGIHASYLPYNRGAASLNWALINDLKETGVSLFYMTKQYDEGDIINQVKISIDERDDISTLHYKSDAASCELLIDALENIRNGTVKTKPQDNKLANYTKSRNPDDGFIEWSSGRRSIWNFVRALTRPFPGAFTFLDGRKIIIWKCSQSDCKKNGEAGELVEIVPGKGILVSTVDGCILVEQIGVDGFTINADEFAEKYGLNHGDRFGH